MSTHRQRKLLLVTALGALLLTAGCMNNNDNANPDTNDANGDGVTAQNYKDDGYLGRTNSYPRIPGHHMTNTYSNDGNAFREAIKNVPGVAGSNVTFNGADAYVTIRLAQGLNPNQIPTVEREAASVLRFNFPRYTIHVSSLGQ